MKKIIAGAISLFLLFTVTGGRAQKYDTLLWYTGHWQGNTFMIHSSLTGDTASGTIRVKPKGVFEITTASNTHWNRKINTEVKNIDKEKEEVVADVRGDQGMLQYNLAVAMKEELDDVKEDINALGTNNAEEDPKSAEKLSFFKTNLKQGCANFEARYNEILAYVKENRGKNKRFNLPPPPVADYNCLSCDPKKQEDYDTAVAHYIIDFFRKEAGMIRDANGILWQLQMLHSSVNDPSVNSAMDQAFSKSGPCHYLNEVDLSLAVTDLAEIECKKAEQLWMDNRTNYDALLPLIRIYLLGKRARQMMGFSEGSDYSSEIAKAIKVLYNREKDKMIKEHDYSRIANIPFMIGMLAQLKLLGDHSMEDDWKQLVDFCTKFQLTYEMDLKTGDKGVYHVAHWKGTAKVIAEFDKNKCVQFHLALEEKDNIHLDLLTNECACPDPHPVYAGTMKGLSPAPQFKFHFCKQGADSIIFTPAIPDGEAHWIVPGGPPLLIWLFESDVLFKNTSLNLEESNESLGNNSGASEDDIKKKKEEAFKKKVEDLQKSGASPQKMAEEIKKLMSSSESIVPVALNNSGKLEFPVSLHNNSKVLVNERFDAKQINPDLANTIVYGYITIILEHDPKK